MEQAVRCATCKRCEPVKEGIPIEGWVQRSKIEEFKEKARQGTLTECIPPKVALNAVREELMSLKQQGYTNSDLICIAKEALGIEVTNKLLTAVLRDPDAPLKPRGPRKGRRPGRPRKVEEEESDDIEQG